MSEQNITPEFTCLECFRANSGLCDSCAKKIELDKQIAQSMVDLMVATTQHKKDIILHKIKQLTAELNKIKTDSI